MLSTLVLHKPMDLVIHVFVLQKTAKKFTEIHNTRIVIVYLLNPID